MTNVSLRNLICGFIAGAIAVMTVHEVVNFLLLELGLFPRIPWSMEPAAIIGVFILVPLITGRFPLFFGGDPKLIVSVLLILGAFGAGMGWLYGLFASRSASA